MSRVVASGTRTLIVALAVAAAVAVTACGQRSSVDEEGQAAGSLVIYSGRSESLVGPIIEQFGVASGIDVAVKYGSTSEIAATLLEEGDRSPADVFFAQDPSGLGAVTGMLAPLPDDVAQAVPSWARSPDRNWVGVSGRVRTIVYNTDNLSRAELPSSMSDFTDEKWRGRIGWAPSNASFQTMLTSMRLLWGEERTRRWLKGIQANEPRVYAKNTPIVAAAAAGEIDVGFVNHYYLYRFIQEDGEDFTARNHYLSDRGPGGLIMVAGAGILDSAKNAGNAEKFLRFLLSTPAQQYFAGQTFEYPVADGVKTHRLLVPLSDIGSPDIDMAALGDSIGTQALLRDVGITP